MVNKNKKILVLPPIDLSRGKEAGGPTGVIKNMYESDANDCFNFIIKNKNEASKKKPKRVDRGNYTLMLKKELAKFAPIKLLFSLSRARKAIYRNRDIVEQYDHILVHNLSIAFLLVRYFPEKNITFVYHGQGSSSHVYYNRNIGGFLTKLILDKIERFVYEEVDKYGFPSRGSKQALISTNDQLDCCLPDEDSKLIILNNGIDIDAIQNESLKTTELITNLERNNETNKLKFCTVAGINKQKGVDRIPHFLGELKDKGEPFVWFLVGEGKNEKEVQEKIEKYNISKETKWYKKKFPHGAIISLFRKCDFYILFHRQSIFDLSILEAMYCECVPVLSKVGGNLEFNKNGNVLFAEKPYNLDQLEEDIDLILNNRQEKLIELQKINKEAVKQNFNLDSFIQRYNKVFGCKR